MKMLRCPICRTLKAVNVRNKTCSYLCGRELAKRRLWETWHDSVQKRASALGAKARKEAWMAPLRTQYPQVPADVWTRVYTTGRDSAYSAGDKNGYKRAWAENL